MGLLTLGTGEVVTISSGRLPDAHMAAYTDHEGVNAREEVPVPLSEEELRALEQMERALVQEDPKLASTLRGTNLRRAARRRAILAGFCFVVGLGVLMTGAIGRVTLVGAPDSFTPPGGPGFMSVGLVQNGVKILPPFTSVAPSGATSICCGMNASPSG